ncbi:DUF5103 domain-containing protein [Gilvibacter sp.]|uniref:type IX secretion system plug protein n=1 Tax=Gilvibacter sp. TaxID=2729997 RepID=UPI003F49ED41
MKYLILLISLVLNASILNAQVEEMPPPENIRTIIFNSGGNQSQLPIIRLGEPIFLTFDDLNANEEDYYYRITHHDFDWKESNLAKGEFMEGYDDVRIRTYDNSLNSLQLYAHYRLSIPNQETRRLTKSGNYMISIYMDTGQLIFSRKFMVIEQGAGVAVDVKRARDFNFINTKQVVQFTIKPGAEFIANPKQTVNTLVIQNYNLKTAITDLKPQYTIGQELIYRYDIEAGFWGGNEYLNFDSKDLRGANIGVSRIEVTDLYNHFLFTNPSRANQPYTFNPDINGNFVVRTLNAVQSVGFEAEYIWMHFRLQYFEELDGKEIHIYGNFNNFNLDDTTKLSYDPSDNVYKGVRKFKQGFYNYKYVLLDRDGSIDSGAVGGNFWETENDYTVLVYYREPGGRFDRIIGYGKGNSNNITNN